MPSHLHGGSNLSSPELSSKKANPGNKNRYQWGMLSITAIIYFSGITSMKVFYILHHQNSLGTSQLFGLGCTVCTLVMLAAVKYKKFAGAGNLGVLSLFNFFVFSCCINLQLAATIHGWTDIGLFYLSKGEPYLLSPHGKWMKLWEAVAHLFFYVWFIFADVNGLRRKYSTLFWAGSMLNCQVVFFLGAMVGRHGDQINPNMLMNLPYFLLSFQQTVWVLSKHGLAQGSRPSTRTAFKGVALGCTVVTVLLLCARLVAVVNPESPMRVLADWDPYLLDSAGFSKAQALTFGLHIVPVLILGGMATTTSITGLMDLAVLALGAVVQAEFTYIMSAMDNNGDTILASKRSKQRFFAQHGIIMVATLCTVLAAAGPKLKRDAEWEEGTTQVLPRPRASIAQATVAQRSVSHNHSHMD